MAEGLENPNDRIRHVILIYFYELHKKAKSVSAAKKGIRDVKSDLKSRGLGSAEIIPNLMYLVKTGWIDEETDAYNLPSKGITAKKVSYRISDLGVDRFEGPSKFQKLRNVSGIDVSNVGGVVVIGEGNVVQTRFERLYRHLDLLEHSISITDGLSNEQKISYLAEVETIKSQLAKPSPDRGIISRAWTALSALSMVPGLVELVETVRKVIGPLVGAG